MGPRDIEPNHLRQARTLIYEPCRDRALVTESLRMKYVVGAPARVIRIGQATDFLMARRLRHSDFRSVGARRNRADVKHT